MAQFLIPFSPGGQQHMRRAGFDAAAAELERWAEEMRAPALRSLVGSTGLPLLAWILVVLLCGWTAFLLAYYLSLAEGEEEVLAHERTLIKDGKYLAAAGSPEL